MLILIRRRVLIESACFVCFFACMAAILTAGHLRRTAVFAARPTPDAVVVIDAGHGGEDGGAVSPDGIAESGLNLAVAERTRDLLRLFGQRTVMTREADVSLSDPGLDTVRKRKASDIRNRVALVERTENAVLLSIHQNSLPSSPVTHGAQVFWNRQAGGEELAKLIQSSLNGAVNTGNEKQAREIPSSIYLMGHITAPAALVECGFLSNAGETARLQEPGYQQMLAAAITAGYLRFAAGEELP